MNNINKRIIYAIENGLNYAQNGVKVVPTYSNVSDKAPNHVYLVTDSGVRVSILKRKNYIRIYNFQGADVRLVNAVLKHFTRGEYKVRKRGPKYVLKRLSEAPIWHVELY